MTERKESRMLRKKEADKRKILLIGKKESRMFREKETGKRKNC